MVYDENWGYLVVHPTDRKWVTTLVVNGISGGKSSTYIWGELTHKNDPWDEPPSSPILGNLHFMLVGGSTSV